MRLLLSSPAFDDKGEIPKKYGYKNKNSSPPLSISNVPSECKSLALIMDDPDAKKVVGKTRINGISHLYHSLFYLNNRQFLSALQIL